MRRCWRVGRIAATMEQGWVRGYFLRRGEKERRSIPEEFQNLAIERSVQEAITFCSIGGRTN